MLVIENLSKTYADGTHALRGLQFQASHGMFGLLGPNGAGKSSLMRTIATLQSPDQGSIHFHDTDVLAEPVKLRRQLGYLPQSFGVYPHMSCLALLEHMAILKGLLERQARRRQIDALLQLTNLTTVAHKTVAHFSGGMRQRFGIAQALLGDPRLLILDEPSAGLDPEERQNLHNLLVEISQSRLVLLSSHIVDDIEQLCQQVAILLGGRIVVRGDTRALIAPLAGQVWQGTGACPALPEGAILLSSTYLRGVPVQRIYLPDEQAASGTPGTPGTPGAPYQAVSASLQDRYFLELQQERV